MYDSYGIRDAEELSEALGLYQRQLESYRNYCGNGRKKFVDELINNITLLKENIDRLSKIDRAIPDLKGIEVPNTEKSTVVADTKNRLNGVINNLRAERQKIMNECTKLFEKTRAMMNSLLGGKEYKSKCEDTHIKIAQVSYLSAVFANQTKSTTINPFVAFEEEKERHEMQLISDKISDVEKIVKDFETAKTYLNNTLLVTPTDSMKGLAADIKKEKNSITSIITPEKTKQIQMMAKQLKNVSCALADLKYLKKRLESVGAISNQQISELISYVDKAIKAAENKRAVAKKELVGDLQKVELATRAMDHYKEVLISNAKLEDDKRQIRANTHPIQDRIRDTEKKANETFEEITKIRIDPKNGNSVEAQLKVERLRDERRKEQALIEEDTKYINDRSEEALIRSLPQEYIDMKEKLAEASTLRKVVEQIMRKKYASNGNKR